MKLTAQGVTKDFIRRSSGTNILNAVHETDLGLEGGTLTVLMGRSGGGKTTLLNILSGLLTPTSGKVILTHEDGDIDLYSLEDKALSALRNRSFGVIPQGQTGIQSLTVTENILLPYTLTGKAPKEALTRAQALMEDLDITHLAEARPRELSGGELRRMAVIRALIRSPQVIFADEPTGDLDDENTSRVFGLLKAEAQRGAAVLIVSHEGCAADYADTVLRMDAGVIKA